MILNQMERIHDVLPGLEKLFSISHCGFAKNVVNESLGCQSSDAMLRNNVSKAVGIVAINHFGPVIEFIEQIYSGIDLFLLMFLRVRLAQDSCQEAEEPIVFVYYLQR